MTIFKYEFLNSAGRSRGVEKPNIESSSSEDRESGRSGINLVTTTTTTMSTTTTNEFNETCSWYTPPKMGYWRIAGNCKIRKNEQIEDGVRHYICCNLLTTTSPPSTTTTTFLNEDDCYYCQFY